jgi:hypothetical protein
LKLKSPSHAEQQHTPSTKRNASPGGKSPGRPEYLLEPTYMEVGLGDMDLDNLDELLDCGDDLMDLE